VSGRPVIVFWGWGLGKSETQGKKAGARRYLDETGDFAQQGRYQIYRDAIT